MSFFFIDLDNDYTSRYDFAKFLEFNSDNFDPLTSNFLADLQAIPSGGRYKIRGNEGRPDNISYAIYGDYQYWWLILIYNGIFTIDDLTSDRVINYPDQDLLEDFYFTLKNRELNK